MTNKTTRRVYSAEELHRLRSSCSQPKLDKAIEEHDSEDAELVKGIICHPCTSDIICKQTLHLAPPRYIFTSQRIIITPHV